MTSFVAKAVALPVALGGFISRPEEYPELHQPAFLPAKLAILARAFLNYLWLSRSMKGLEKLPFHGLKGS